MDESDVASVMGSRIQLCSGVTRTYALEPGLAAVPCTSYGHMNGYALISGIEIFKRRRQPGEVRWGSGHFTACYQLGEGCA